MIPPPDNFNTSEERIEHAIKSICLPFLNTSGEKSNAKFYFELCRIAWNSVLYKSNDYEAKIRKWDDDSDAKKEYIINVIQAMRDDKLLKFPYLLDSIDTITIDNFFNPHVVLEIEEPSNDIFTNHWIKKCPDTMRLHESFIRALARMGNKAEAESMKNYHKTSYNFFGVRMPEINKLVNDVARVHNEGTLEFLAEFLWHFKYFESFMATGKILACSKVDNPSHIWRMIEKFSFDFDSWAMADVFIPAATKALKGKPQYLDIFEQSWLSDTNIWCRRACLTFTLYSAKPNGDPTRSLEWAAKLVSDQEWFIQKAIAWYLRELSKHNPKRVVSFLSKYSNQMKPFAIKEASKYLKDF